MRHQFQFLLAELQVEFWLSSEFTALFPLLQVHFDNHKFLTLHQILINFDLNVLTHVG